MYDIYIYIVLYCILTYNLYYLSKRFALVCCKTSESAYKCWNDKPAIFVWAFLLVLLLASVKSSPLTLLWQTWKIPPIERDTHPLPQVFEGRHGVFKLVVSAQVSSRQHTVLFILFFMAHWDASMFFQGCYRAIGLRRKAGTFWWVSWEKYSRQNISSLVKISAHCYIGVCLTKTLELSWNPDASDVSEVLGVLGVLKLTRHHRVMMFSDASILYTDMLHFSAFQCCTWLFCTPNRAILAWWSVDSNISPLLFGTAPI